MKKGFWIVFLLFCGTLIAQKTVIDTSNSGYKSTLISYYENQILKTKALIEKIDDRKIRKQFIENYTQNTTDFKALIKKGIFIEHESYSDLVQNIFQTIKKNNSGYNFDEIKILLSVNKEINAYNSGDGIVVLNLPIIYNIKNQYELAFVLCHEISHQKLNHVYNHIYKSCTLENSAEIKNKTQQIDKQKYNKGALASELFKKIVYGSRKASRQNEKSADSLGYILFKNSYPEYDSYAVETLRTLKKIDIVKDSLQQIDFEKLFETPSLKFKTDWLISDLSNYNYQKAKRFWDVDSLRTHPDCDQRILHLQKAFKIQEKNKSFDASVFNNSRKNAGYEAVFELYFLEDYGNSLYETLLQLKKNPVDLFYRKMVYDNLLKLQVARNNYTLNRFLETENPKFTQSYNQFLCLIRNLRKTEMNEFITYYKSKL